MRSHIYPKGFYTFEELPLVAMTTNPATRAKRIPIGIYDEELVIEEVEKSFAKLDDYAIRTFRPEATVDQLFRENGRIAVDDDGSPLAYQIANVDHDKLKQFFISVLWRAGATARPEFNQLDLGPHQERLRDLLVRGATPGAEEYSVVAERFIDGDAVPVMPFFPDRIDGVRFQIAVFGGFRFWVKCDRRKTPAPFGSMQLSPNRPLTILISRFKDSTLRTSLAAIAKAYAATHGDPWRKNRA